MGVKKLLRQQLRKNMTPEELKLWQYLRKEQLGVKFRRQNSIGPYIVDFYSPKIKLVIEVDGTQHYTKTGLEYDEIRENYMKSLKIKTLRFKNKEIRKEIEFVIETIKKEIIL